MVDYIYFYDTKGEYGFLSNFYPIKPLVIDNESWFGGTEAYFQAQKFRGPISGKKSIEYSNIFKMADTPGKVKMLGNQKKNMRFGKNWVINKKNDTRLVNSVIDEYKDVKMRSDWNDKRIPVMIYAIVHKFMQNPLLLQKLVNIPKNTLLVEHTTRDSVWGDGGSGQTLGPGSNYLGKILTTVAYILRDGSCDNMTPSLKKAVKITQ